METRILKIKGHSIYYTPNEYLSFTNSNFPSIEDFKFRSHTEVLWEVEIKKYDVVNKILHVKIIDYQSDKLDSFHNQSKKNKALEGIFFDYILWDKLEPQFMHFKKSSFRDIVDEESYNNSNNQVREYNDTLEKSNFNNSVSNTESNNQLDTYVEDFHTKIYFKDAIFLDGFVRFIFYTNEHSEKVELEIVNPQLKKEFDFIKYHFQKIFNRKTFDVYGTKTSTSTNTKFDNLSSPQIGKIDNTIIEQIKLNEYKRITKITHKENSKKLLDINEIFSELSLDTRSGLFNKNEEELIKFFLKVKTIRNKQQLLYLSGLKQSISSNIKVTLSPHFGFLFTITGKKNTYYCWELLNSHATYIWKIPIDTNDEFKIIEENINLITKIGRQRYKEKLRNEKSFITNNISFKLIRHSKNLNGFNDWKNMLDQITQ